MKTIIFVCHGSICRSPAAAFIAKQYLKEINRDKEFNVLIRATSSIDTRTERLVQKGMDQLMKGRTTFVIAHRLSTIQNADYILVLDKGQIIERGNHESLIAEKGYYYQLYTGAFELE